jgi:hypothetical protein
MRIKILYKQSIIFLFFLQNFTTVENDKYVGSNALGSDPMFMLKSIFFLQKLTTKIGLVGKMM